MKLLVFLHRWLGTITCLFFLLWFASGIVMIYAEMPQLSREERLAALPRLNLSLARLSAAEAMERAQLDYFDGMRLTSLFGRPAWSIRSGGDWYTVFADTGAANAYVVTDSRLPTALYGGLKVEIQIGASTRLVAS